MKLVVSSIRNSPLGLGMLPVVPTALGLVSRELRAGILYRNRSLEVISFQRG